jgi:hypothetical protein
MVDCKALSIPSVISGVLGLGGFVWLALDTERGNNRFRTGVQIVSLAFVAGGVTGGLFWVTGTCESDRK